MERPAGLSSGDRVSLGASTSISDLDWNQVRTFVAVVKTGSLAGGARRLGLAHPTIARHIQQLEETLGLSLFDRSSNGLVLNRVGDKLAEAADAMQQHATAFELLSDTEKNKPIPVLRVTVAELMAEAMPALLMPAKSQDCDNLVSVVELLVANHQLNLLERDADIAIRHVRPNQQELVCRRVGSLVMGLYASQSYLQSHGDVDFDSFADHRFIDGVQHHHFVKGAERIGYTIGADQIAFRSDSMVCQRSAVEAGWGMGGFPVVMMRERTSLTNVMAALSPESSVELDVWLVARPEVRENLHFKRTFDELATAIQAYLAQQW